MFPARLRPEADPLAALPFDGPAFESRLAWIFGSPRTGSTWLLRMLVYPLRAGEEPSGLKRKRRKPKVPNIVVPVNESHVPLHLTPLRRIKAQEAEMTGPDDFVMNTRHLHRSSYLFSEDHGEIAWPWARSMILDRFYHQAELAMEAHGVDDCVVVIKEPNGSHGAHRIMGLLPNAKLVFLMRDGRDVVDSALTLHLPGGSREDRGRGIRNDEDRLRYVTIGARLWVNRMNAVQRAYDAHDPARRLKVRYEDLRANTVEELSRLVEFLGLDRTRETIVDAVEDQAYKSKSKKEQALSRRSASTGEWRKSLRPDEQEVVEGIMGEKLVELGYE